MGNDKGLNARGKEINKLFLENGIKLENYDLKKVLKRIKEKGIFN